MPQFLWTILELTVIGNIIRHAEYRVTLIDGEYKVSTQGNWDFINPVTLTDVSSLTPDQAAIFLEKDSTVDGVNSIKSRLEEQMAVVKNGKASTTPWKSNVFVASI